VEVVGGSNWLEIVTFYDRQGKEIATYNPWIWALKNGYEENYYNMRQRW